MSEFTITVRGKQYKLLFGRAAVEEISTRLGAEFVSNDFKQCADMIYAGMLNNAIREDQPIPKYSEVHDICEDFYDEDDALEQYKAMNEAFEESKFGKRFIEKIKELTQSLNKKTEELVSL